MKAEELDMDEIKLIEADLEGVNSNRTQGRPGEDRKQYKKRDQCRGPCYDKNNLYSLMRACGRHLYHCAKFSGQGKILAILSEREKMTQKELQDLLQIQSGSMSEIITKLEEKGLLRRRRDEDDKRRSVLELTDAGREAAIKYAMHRDEQSFFRVLEEEEQKELKVLLGKLLDNWKQEEEALRTHTEKTGAE